MVFIDTHSHFYLPQFDEDVDRCITNAKDSGVAKIILPNIDSETILANKKLSAKYPDTCYSLMGLHPTHVKENYEEELASVLSELENGNYVGVGEIGMDLYWDKTFIEEQKDAFRQQISYAKAKDLPFVIHSRESFREVIEVLESLNTEKFKGIFHAFSGSVEEAGKVIEMGFYIGIGGVVTFKNSSLPELVKQVDLNHIVLETDSPYLAPTPYRGKRNESSYIPIIAKKIAEIKEVKLEEVAEITSWNSINLFNI